MSVRSLPARVTPNRSLTLSVQLLGFTLPARQPQTNVVGSPRRSNRRHAGHGVYDKQKFVNAQMRFVLKPTGGTPHAWYTMTARRC